MSDRIKQLKREDRKIPKNPVNTNEGPRRLSRGVIGVKKTVRRGSDKSDSSTGSRWSNPFSDLIPSRSRSSVNVLTATNSETGQSTHIRRKSVIAPIMKSNRKSGGMTSRDHAVQQLVSTSLSRHGMSAKSNTPTMALVLPSKDRLLKAKSPKIPQGRSPSMTHSYLQENPLPNNDPPFMANSPKIAQQNSPMGAYSQFPDNSETTDSALRSPGEVASPAHSPESPSAIDQDEVTESGSTAMATIDRFLDSLRSSSPSNSSQSGISDARVVDDQGPWSDIGGSDRTSAAPRDRSQTSLEHAENVLAANNGITTRPRTPETKREAQHIGTRRRKNSTGSTCSASSLESEVRNTRPLSIQKSPSSIGSSPPIDSSHEATAKDESDPSTFRGVNTDWLLSMYNEYMATKGSASQNTDPSSQAPEQLKSETSPQRGLRPLLLPAVVATADTAAYSATSSSAIRPDQSSSQKRTPPKAVDSPVGTKLTFGAPRTSPQATIRKQSGPSSALDTADFSTRNEVYRPALQRSNTGVSQEGAAELVRRGLISRTNTDTDLTAYVPQVLEATASLKYDIKELGPPLESPGPAQPSQVQSTTPSLAKGQHVPPPITIPGPSVKLASPLPSPSYFREMKRPMSSLGAEARSTSLVDPKTPIELARPSASPPKMHDRKRIVSNNVSFYDPFEGDASPSMRFTPSPVRSTFVPNTISPRDERQPTVLSQSISSVTFPSTNTGVQSDDIKTSRPVVPVPPQSVETSQQPAAVPFLDDRSSSYDEDEELLAYPMTPKLNHSAKQVKMLGIDSSASDHDMRPTSMSRQRSNISSDSDDDLLPKPRKMSSAVISSKASKLLGMSDNVKKQVIKQKLRSIEDKSYKSSPSASSSTTGSRKVAESVKSHVSGQSGLSASTRLTHQSQMTITSILSRSSANTVGKHSSKTSNTMVDEPAGLGLQAVVSKPKFKQPVLEPVANSTKSYTQPSSFSDPFSNSTNLNTIPQAPAVEIFGGYEPFSIARRASNLPEMSKKGRVSDAGMIPIVIDTSIPVVRDELSPGSKMDELFSHYSINQVPVKTVLSEDPDSPLGSPVAMRSPSQKLSRTASKTLLSPKGGEFPKLLRRTSSVYSHDRPQTPELIAEPEKPVISSLTGDEVARSTGVFGDYRMNRASSQSSASDDYSRQMLMSPSMTGGPIVSTASVQRFSSPPPSTLSRSSSSSRIRGNDATIPVNAIPEAPANSTRPTFKRSASKRSSYGASKLASIQQSPQLGRHSPPVSEASESEVEPESQPKPQALGLSLSRPTSSNPLDHILFLENQSKKSKAVNRLSTLERINQTALPSRDKSPALSIVTTGSTSTSKTRSLKSPTPSEVSFDRQSLGRSSVKSATTPGVVPISYYAPRSEQPIFDPFKNLDMQAVSARSPPASVSGDNASTSAAAQSIAPRKKNQQRPMSMPAAPKSTQIYTRSERGSIFAMDAQAAAGRNYTAGSVTQPKVNNTEDEIALVELSQHSHVPRTAKAKTSKRSSAMSTESKSRDTQPRSKPRPATMMSPAPRLDDHFDIRRAIARSDDGKDQFEDQTSSGPHLKADDEDNFGLFTTQAFSKWFG